MTSAVQTIREMELATYGAALDDYVQKADVYSQTTTSNYYDAIHGMYAWSQLNLEANFVSCMPKAKWQNSGLRLITARPTMSTVGGITVKGGTPEGGPLAETTLPGMDKFAIKPKVAQIGFGSSMIMEWLVNNGQDDAWGSMANLRMYMALQHSELLNQMMLADVQGQAAAAASNAPYTPTLDWETADRLVSDDAEEDAVGGAGTGFYDAYGLLDRDSGTKYDSTVVAPSGTIGTTAALTKSAILEAQRKSRSAGGIRDVSFMIGGHEVYSELQELFEGALRYGHNESIITLDVGGVKTFTGTGVGLRVASVYGVPFIATKDAPAHGTTEVGRIFGLDISDGEGFGRPRMCVSLSHLTDYREADMSNPAWPFVTGGFKGQGVYFTAGDLLCSRFPGQFKIRDIRV